MQPFRRELNNLAVEVNLKGTKTAAAAIVKKVFFVGQKCLFAQLLNAQTDCQEMKEELLRLKWRRLQQNVE